MQQILGKQQYCE